MITSCLKNSCWQCYKTLLHWHWCSGLIVFDPRVHFSLAHVQERFGSLPCAWWVLHFGPSRVRLSYKGQTLQLIFSIAIVAKKVLYHCHLGLCALKLFMTIKTYELLKATVFVTLINLCSSLIFASNMRSLHLQWSLVRSYSWWASALPTIIREVTDSDKHSRLLLWINNSRRCFIVQALV